MGEDADRCGVIRIHAEKEILGKEQHLRQGAI